MIRTLFFILLTATIIPCKAQFQINHKDLTDLRGKVDFFGRKSSTLYCKNGFAYVNDTFSVSYKYIKPNHQQKAGRNMFVPATTRPVYYAFDKQGRTTMEGIQKPNNENNWTMVKYDSLGRISYKIFEIIFEDEDEEKVLFSMERDIKPEDRQPAKNKPSTLKGRYQMSYDENKNPLSRTWFNNEGEIAWRLVYEPDSVTPEICAPTTDTDAWEVEKNEMGLPILETGINKNGSITQTIKIEYDDNNYPMTEYWLDANERLHLTWNYQYTPDGKLIELEVTKNKKSLFQWRFTYTEKGDILSLKRKTDGQTTTWRSAYEYDDHGNWILQYQYKNQQPKYGVSRKINYY